MFDNSDNRFEYVEDSRFRGNDPFSEMTHAFARMIILTEIRLVLIEIKVCMIQTDC